MTAADSPSDTIAPRPKGSRLQFSLRTLLFAPLAVAIAMLVAFPKLTTGDYVNITVTKVEYQGDGRVLLELEFTASAGTGLVITSGSKSPFQWSYLNHCEVSSPLPTWPHRGRMEVMLCLSPMRTFSAGDHRDLPDQRDLLSVEAGDTFRLTGDNQVELMRVSALGDDNAGITHELSSPPNRIGWGFVLPRVWQVLPMERELEIFVYQ